MGILKVSGLALAAAVVLASTAPAATWDPPGTVQHGHGNVTFVSGSATWSCTIELNLKASGAAATTTTAAGADAGPTWSGCANNLGLSPMHTTSASAWVATATSTSSVDLSNFSYSINLGSGTCIITVTGTTLAGNTWSNSTHAFTFNPAAIYPQHRAGFCPLTGPTGSLSGSISFPASMVIT